MTRRSRWLVATLVVTSCVLMAVYVAIHVLGDRKAARVIDIHPSPVRYTGDRTAIAHGEYLYRSRGCADCHGDDGSGRVVIDDPGGLYVRAPNITVGRGSAVIGYIEDDRVRGIRHGVDRERQPLLIMPSEDYNRLTDADLSALVAYVRALPPMAGELAEIRLPLIVKALYAMGVMRDAAEKIDHDLPPSRPVPVAASLEHGAYVANMCIGCHGRGFSGGTIPGAPPSWPTAANLTPGSDSALRRYDTADKLEAMFRTGRRPDGSAVSSVMPFGSLKVIDDIDLEAMHRFLMALPPRPAGSR